MGQRIYVGIRYPLTLRKPSPGEKDRRCSVGGRQMNILNPRRDFCQSVTWVHTSWNLLLRMNQWLNAGRCINVNYMSTERKDFILPIFLCCKESMHASYLCRNSTFTNSRFTAITCFMIHFFKSLLRRTWNLRKKTHCNSVTITVSAFALCLLGSPLEVHWTITPDNKHANNLSLAVAFRQEGGHIFSSSFL